MTMRAEGLKQPTIEFTKIREDFPILQQGKQGKSLVYLDSAASAQKPRQVVEALSKFYLQDYANIHRGIYELSARATLLYERARTAVKNFIHAGSDREVVFVRGTTEGINLVAQCFERLGLKSGDEIILSQMEHHSNIVPWYFLKEKFGIELKVVPIHDDGSLDLETYQSLFSSRTILTAVTHVSNALGIINPIKQMTQISHAHNVPILVDGAQAVPHLPIDLEALDCDFYVFSGHKLYGPTGIGALCIQNKWLSVFAPYQGGGDMIETVSFSKVTYAKAAQKFEAGTPHIAGAIGLHAAIHYIKAIGMQNIFIHEQHLLAYAEKQLAKISGLSCVGTAKPKVGVISFVMDGIHPHDLATVLDHEGIAIRAGHHCAMPLMERLGLPATVRVSFGIYNQEADIDLLIEAIQLAKRLL